MILITIAIVIAVIAATIFVGIFSFNKIVERERVLLVTSDKAINERIRKEDLNAFPDLMKNYLINVKVVGKPKYCNVVFKQKGTIRTNPNKGWLAFTATQYISSNNSGFIWKAKAFPMLIRDKYLDQTGEVKVSILGLKNVALFSGSEVDQSSLGRYLGELIWFPIGFLDSDISWETVDPKTVKATISKGGLSVEGFFIFDNNGMIDSFRTKRYRDVFLEDFIGRSGTYKEYDGLMLPDTMTAIWDLKDGELEYFRARISDYFILNVNN